jgi:Arm DNA-binding domain
MLTDVKLRALLAQPPETRLDVRDGSITGLTLRKGPHGQPIWTLRFTVKGAGGMSERGHKLAGREFYRLTLGTYPLVSLQEARAAATLMI